MPRWLSLGFQDPSAILLVEFSNLHDHILVIITIVMILVTYVMLLLFSSSNFYKYFSEGTLIETIWSIIPALLLILLVVPSVVVLYILEDLYFPCVTVKITGHQWYWSYEVPVSLSLDSVSYDSILTDEIPRLFSCRTNLVLPISVPVRFLVTSRDVIHSFSAPSLGLKIDAVPGRINQIFGVCSRLGYFFGQCSEICGSYHSFMPICIDVVDFYSYLEFLETLCLDLVVGKYSLDCLDLSFSTA